MNNKYELGQEVPVSCVLTITGINPTKKGGCVYSTDRSFSIRENILEQIEMKPREKPLAAEPVTPQQEDKPTYKPGDKVKVIGNTCSHGYPIGEILTLAECVMRNCRPAWNVAESDIWYIREADIEPYTEPEQEPIRLYCAKEFLPGTWLTKGKIYKVTANDKVKMDDGYITEYDSEGLGDTPFDQYFVPLVKRPAKVGEYILIVDCYNRDFEGEICEVIKTGAMLQGRCLSDNSETWIGAEYLVLDGYAPEPKYYNGEVVCTESDRFFIVGKIYEFRNGLIKCENGDTYNRDEPIKTLNDLNDGTWVSKFIPYKGKAADK